MSSHRPGPYEAHPDSAGHHAGWAHEYPQAAHPAPQQAHHPAQRHSSPQKQARPKQTHRRGKTADYTLMHAGRQVRLGPVAFWIVVGTLVVMAGWSVSTGTYFAFHDDVLKRLIARQAQMQFAYEDRIAELRAQVDRITSRQLLDQEQFEGKLDQILRRQSALEQRATTLNNLGDVTGSVKGSARGAAPAPLKPSPINDTVIFSAPPDREARLESRPLPVSETAKSARRMKGGLEGTLARLSDSLDRIALRQVQTLNTLEEKYDAKAKRMRAVLTDLGLNAGKAPLTTGSIGGPYVPANIDTNTFDKQIYRINATRTQVDKLTSTLAAVPVRKPVVGEIDVSSPFGMRMDPFMKGPAIHTGIDMRGEMGEPVHATATGTVTIAGWNGGYGKMVEINHGNDLATRYGHLSAIDVTVGQKIRIGQVIGRIGSTGRSTGPHLHYETRVDGEAVNPEKFLRAGLRLGNSIN
jgi:murein DD-endopeptidase MepM/ murein hydrolase activator NlpD